MKEYQTQFEKHENHIKGLHDLFFKSYFISRLKDDGSENVQSKNDYGGDFVSQTC